MQNDIRAELIKQFPAEVEEIPDMTGTPVYVCPTCKRAVALKNEKCENCGQVLGWGTIRKKQAENGLRTATLKFEVEMDFTKGDCRKCPLSYIAKEHNESVYQCPLKMRGDCKLEIS